MRKALRGGSFVVLVFALATMFTSACGDSNPTLSPSSVGTTPVGVVVNSVVPQSGNSLTTGSYSISITTAPNIKVGVVNVVGDKSAFVGCMTTGTYSSTSFISTPIVLRTTIILIPVSMETDCGWLRLNWQDASLTRIEAAHWNY